MCVRVRARAHKLFPPHKYIMSPYHKKRHRKTIAVDFYHSKHGMLAKYSFKMLMFQSVNKNLYN